MSGWSNFARLLQNQVYLDLGGFGEVVLKLTLGQLALASFAAWLYYMMKSHFVVREGAFLAEKDEDKRLLQILSRLFVASPMLVSAGVLSLAFLNPVLSAEIILTGLLTYLAAVAITLASGAAALSRLNAVSGRIEILLVSSGILINALTIATLGLLNPLGLAVQALGLFLAGERLLKRCSEACGPAAMAEADSVMHVLGTG
ncbi:hypothetical protein [Aeropyrum camini]|uniref:hypothetical protein n=1 Tax=Aeropyrum camini TaxID=229980 RepID=UPI0011E5BD83|nr:hypothetical protein [Aeropyrum camini]